MKYKIIIPSEEPKQEVLEEVKQRAVNYMSLKGALEPKDVILGYKTSLDAQMLNSQYVDFSNTNADKISSASTISIKQETTLEEATERPPYFELVDKKAESNNTIDLDAYANL